MTTATATTEGQEDRTGTEVDVEDGRVPTESILTGQEGDEAVDSAEAEAAMLAGWKRVGKNANASDDTLKGGKDGDDADEEDITDVVFKESTAKGNDTLPGANADTLAGADADPEIPGLGMKASQVKAALGELESVKKTAASLAGSLGHLKQLVTSAGQGKKVTPDSLKKVSEEFGPEFANALAEDLNTAGFGGGASVDTATIEQMVNEKVSAAREEANRTFEKKLVTRAHPDADEHFARIRLDANGNPVTQKDKDGNDAPVWEAGAKHAAFMAFVQTLPQARQDELFGAGGWDSSVVIRALDEFKAHEKKAATTQATQQQRIARAAVPKSRGGEAQQPAVDPVMQGWNNVRGRRAAGPAGAGGRGR